jgi:hypothetical protein
MTCRTSPIAISLVAFLGLSPGMCAQKAKGPTLEDILQRLEENLNHYDTMVPSFICDEHVVSQVVPGQGNPDTVTNSVFRLKRTPNPDHTTTLVELRDIKDVDGKPPASWDVGGPTLLSGAFEGGLAVVSLTQTSCTNYTLQKISKKRPNAPYVVRFATLLTPENTATCLLQEESTGRAVIDPASMQITHLELKTPRHIIIPEDRSASAVVGTRYISVDYVPVLLGGERFWMPSMIGMHSTSETGTFHKSAWSFAASYRGCHELKVTARIRAEK